jgi:hypothetical protein
MTLTIGIDPGVAGAIAVVNAANEVLVWDMPTIEVRGKKRISARHLRDLGVGSDKGAHRLAAQRLWPLDNLFDRVKDDGRADSALLAHWWMRWAG